MSKGIKSTIWPVVLFSVGFLFGAYLQQDIIRHGLFRNGEFILDFGRGKIVGHVEVELTEIKKRWVPAGADNR
jgi:hypothetical protein